MKFIKFLLITAVAGVALLLTTTIFIGVKFTEGAQALVDVANKPVTQRIERDNDGQVVIVAPLNEQLGIVFRDISLCTPDDHAEDSFFDPVVSDGFSTNRSCVNGSCTVTFKVDSLSSVPDHVQMYTPAFDGSCEKTSLPTADLAGVTGYKATIEFTEKLKEALGLSSDDIDIKSDHSIGVMTWQVMGTKKSKFTYTERPMSDYLTVNGHSMVQLRFE